MDFVFTNYAKVKFLKLDKGVRVRILKKLKNFKKLPFEKIPFIRLKGDFDIVTHRLRVGDYRLICFFENQRVMILDVGHRREIYK